MKFFHVRVWQMDGSFNERAHECIREFEGTEHAPTYNENGSFKTFHVVTADEAPHALIFYRNECYLSKADALRFCISEYDAYMIGIIQAKSDASYMLLEAHNKELTAEFKQIITDNDDGLHDFGTRGVPDV